MEPYRYKGHVRDIIHLVQVNEGIHLSDKSRWDIESRARQAVIEDAEDALGRAESWKTYAKELKSKGYERKWNEFRLKLARLKFELPKEATKEEIIEFMLDAMAALDDGHYIRDMRMGDKPLCTADLFVDAELLYS